MGVVIGEMVGHTTDTAVQFGAAEFLRVDRLRLEGSLKATVCDWKE
ncbi:MAG: hypothetical protein ACRER2_10125 [Methylococcales bacterium]